MIETCAGSRLFRGTHAYTPTVSHTVIVLFNKNRFLDSAHTHTFGEYTAAPQCRRRCEHVGIKLSCWLDIVCTNVGNACISIYMSSHLHDQFMHSALTHAVCSVPAQRCWRVGHNRNALRTLKLYSRKGEIAHALRSLHFFFDFSSVVRFIHIPTAISVRMCEIGTARNDMPRLQFVHCACLRFIWKIFYGLMFFFRFFCTAHSTVGFSF